jgi:hypothetical protein
MHAKSLYAAVITVACSLSASISNADEAPQPAAVLPQPAAVPERPVAVDPVANLRPTTLEKELDAIKALLKQLDERIRRLDVMLECDRTVQARNEALHSWQQLQHQRETLADFAEKDSQARETYFKARAQVTRVLEQLGRLAPIDDPHNPPNENRGPNRVRESANERFRVLNQAIGAGIHSDGHRR